MIEIRGLITGPADLLAKLPKAAFAVSSWDNTHSPNDVRAESVFDAAHGRRFRRHHVLGALMNQASDLLSFIALGLAILVILMVAP